MNNHLHEQQSQEVQKDLVTFFSDSPLVGIELDLDRDKSLSRDIDL